MIRHDEGAFLVFLGALMWLGPAMALEAQASDDGRAGQTVPRTSDGRPDLQGNWTNGTVTPLQRPGHHPDLVLSPAEVAEEEARLAARVELELVRSVEAIDPENRPDITQEVALRAVDPMVGNYDDFWWESGYRLTIVNGEVRSSIITRPADGRIPALIPEAVRQLAEEVEFRNRFGAYDHPEIRPFPERCLLPFNSGAGPPVLPGAAYNGNWTIVQTPDHLMLLSEMIHDVRIIPIGDGPSDPARPEVPDHIRPWMGISWGWWEDDTLIVETTNIHGQQPLTSSATSLNGNGPAASERRTVIERFTRIGEEILYEFTVADPLVYVESWGGEYMFYPLDGLLYEYSCHEHNYGFENVLRGARFRERAAGQN